MKAENEFLKCKRVERMKDIKNTYPWMTNTEAVYFNKELKTGKILYVPIFEADDNPIKEIDGILSYPGFMITDSGGRWFKEPFRPIVDSCGTLWFDSRILT